VWPGGQRRFLRWVLAITANIYAHVMPELQQDAAAKMGAFLRGDG
jgi:hypothetical protein